MNWREVRRVIADHLKGRFVEQYVNPLNIEYQMTTIDKSEKEKGEQNPQPQFIIEI